MRLYFCIPPPLPRPLFFHKMRISIEHTVRRGYERPVRKGMSSLRYDWKKLDKPCMSVCLLCSDELVGGDEGLELTVKIGMTRARGPAGVPS